MNTIPYHPLIQVSQEEIVAVRQSCGLNTKVINENLHMIEEWCKKQDHLVEALPYLNRSIIERFHVLGRGSIEQTKSIIENVLTIRGIHTTFVHNDMKIVLNEFKILLDNVLISPLPKINPIDKSRVLFLRLMNEDFEDINMMTVAKFCFFIIEVRLHKDYIFSDRVIFDLKHVKTSIITKLNPIVLMTMDAMFLRSYKIKSKSFHVLNAPTFVNRLVSIFKPIIKEKLSNRIYIHSSYDELYQVISKEVLPKEYGGDQPSCYDLAEQWKDYLKTENAKYIIENSSKLVTNESRRSGLKFNEEYLGMPGSFKWLDLD